MIETRFGGSRLGMRSVPTLGLARTGWHINLRRRIGETVEGEKISDIFAVPSCSVSHIQVRYLTLQSIKESELVVH